jgi:hypothetical protein
LLAIESPRNDKIDFIAREIIPSIVACARAASKTGGSLLISIERGLMEREVVEFVSGCFCPGRSEIVAELVRVNFNTFHVNPTLRMLQVRLRLLIGPFIEGVGHVRIDDVPEGIVVIGLDDRRIKD